MTNPMIRIHNVETDEVIDREMNSAELKQYTKDCAEFEALKNLAKDAENAKFALLAKLGITTEEIALLLE